MYHLAVIILTAVAVVRGYRRGLTGQVTSVLGMAFGVVCAHIFMPGLSDMLAEILPASRLEYGGAYLTENLAVGLVFFVVYGVFRSVTGVISGLLRGLGTNLLDSLLGAIYCSTLWLSMLSMLFNVAVGWTPGSSLLHDAEADDGNVVRLVTSISPAMLGSESLADFAHEVQLREAKKISLLDGDEVRKKEKKEIYAES